jgi:hypothetical protein
LGTHQERRGPQIHKRDADQAELDVPNASGRFRRSSAESTTEPLLDAQETPRPVVLGSISEEPLEAGVSQYQPQVSKSAFLSDASGDSTIPPRRSSKLEKTGETSQYQRSR